MGCSQSMSAIESAMPNEGKRDLIPGSVVSVQQTQVETNSEDGSSRLTRGNSSDSLPSTQPISSACPKLSDERTTEEPCVQLLDIDAAVADLNQRTAANNPDAEDPFADDSSAVFDVDEDFLLDSDNLSIGSAGAQEALRGLTLEAKLSLVELVRSNSINQLMTA